MNEHTTIKPEQKIASFVGAFLFFKVRTEAKL